MNRNDRGFSLVETMIATLIAFMAVTGLGFTVFVAMVANRNQGQEQTRLTALADEKIEELVRLTPQPGQTWDLTTNTTLITDTGWSIGLTASPAAEDMNMLTACPAAGSPDAGYVDFLDVNGTALGGSCASIIANWSYQRRWQIKDLPPPPPPAGTPTTKQITVVVFSRLATDAGGKPTQVSLTTFKSQ